MKTIFKLALISGQIYYTPINLTEKGFIPIDCSVGFETVEYPAYESIKEC